MSNPFRYFNSSPEVIRLVVTMYVRYLLSLRNVEDLLAERGIDISHETVGCWSDSDMVKLHIMSHAFGRTPRQRVDTIIRSAVALFKTSERNALILTFARSPRRLDAPIILSAAAPCLHHSSC
jgi:hypothetical protein